MTLYFRALAALRTSLHALLLAAFLLGTVAVQMPSAAASSVPCSVPKHVPCPASALSSSKVPHLQQVAA